jgi:nucleoside-diphosphate-sugar epimerase
MNLGGDDAAKAPERVTVGERPRPRVDLKAVFGLEAGPWAWTTAERQAFANDINSPQLWIATTSANSAKSDYDPYSRTKKFCEHMVHELLPDVPLSVFRPSIVLGDSRRPETTQFDMVHGLSLLEEFTHAGEGELAFERAAVVEAAA